ncbi:UBN2 domain-containing protein [Gossypium australe]|uniref:UBN2 domain-containing protein n=1 Tax=Gossypium australe TaxID=47621 RepID=A0A5B6V541_9ROSI|nr:UBN2 domain-containing protein [Gossypium australe]
MDFAGVPFPSSNHFFLSVQITHNAQHSRQHWVTELFLKNQIRGPETTVPIRQTKHKAYVTAWSDEDSSNNEDQEVVSLCLMVINDSKVTSNSSISNPYSIDK